MALTPERRHVQRPPQARVERNRGRILDAAVLELSEGGWDALRPARAGARAGLSRRPAESRFPDRSALAAAVWTERLDRPLTEALATTLRAAGLLEDGGDPVALPVAIRAFQCPDTPLQAAAELLVLSHFNSELRARVQAGAGAAVSAWVIAEDASLSPPESARRAYVLALALGLLLHARRPGVGELDLTLPASALLAALTADVAPALLPAVDAPHLDAPPEFGTGEPPHEDLLRAVLDEVLERGFDGATVDRIVRRAGVSEGYMFARYPTKSELFHTALRVYRRRGYEVNEAFMTRLAAETSPAIAEAVTIREIMSPEYSRLRTMDLEQIRVPWHAPELSRKIEAELEALTAAVRPSVPGVPEQERLASIHWELALGAGCSLLPALAPEAWRLPFDVVTVPLLDGTSPSAP